MMNCAISSVQIDGQGVTFEIDDQISTAIIANSRYMANLPTR